MSELERKQRLDIDTALNNQLKRTIDDYSNIQSPYTYNLLLCENKSIGRWVENSTSIINYAIGENETLRFNLGVVEELQYKRIKEVNLHIEYEVQNNAGSRPCLVGLGMGKNNSLSYLPLDVYLNGFSIDVACKTLGLSEDRLNTIIHDKEFEVELVFNGNLSNARVIISSLLLKFKFENGFKDESDAIVNRLPSVIKVDGVKYNMKHENNELVLTKEV